MKQLKLVRAGGYSQDERHFFKRIILDNIVRSMRSILEAMAVFDISVENSVAAQHLQVILMPDVFAAVKALWK
jgi:hypothetical protein